MRAVVERRAFHDKFKARMTNPRLEAHYRRLGVDSRGLPRLRDAG
jgi:hypothetical protein